MNPSLFLICIIAFVFALWPDRSMYELTVASYKIQIYFLNLRMKLTAWLMYRKLVADFKKHFGTTLPPFKWVDIWDRKSL